MGGLSVAPLKLLEDGRPWPLGAHWDGAGVNFTLFSQHAERVELCLFDGELLHVLELPCCTDQVWHGYLRGAAPGLRYAYRVDGPRLPGNRFDPKALLLDPYARAISGRFAYQARVQPSEGLQCCVVDEHFDWGDDAPPLTPWADSVIYEIHVKGATRQHPGVPERLRGTYAGLVAPAMLEHYRQLGVTAVNLLPVHGFVDEERLVASGRTNYWGYNTLTFFAPEARYAASQDEQSAIKEFRAMVRALHAAGIEVILDVVFNHTAETDEYGPTISFRGIDNRSYYRLAPDDPGRYENFSGCGNTVNLAHPRVLQLVMDALRYWVAEMHVDGFRFDLAAALTRDSAFLAAVRQDPLLARVKLIAEPWDLGPDGYRLGRFPPGWGEWNDRFRDDVRAFWLTGDVGPAALAQRLAGSSELFARDGRTPQAGVNYLCAHDGFTLRDLVSYARKHNEHNGEDNRDGHAHNHSTNCGVEGVSDDPEVLARRIALQRALLATLFVAQGVPMLQGGDEMGRTQAGNNNAYCQDNVITWTDWAHADRELIEFAAGLIALRQHFPQLRRATWLSGKSEKGSDGQRDAIWWHAEGREMTSEDWARSDAPTLGLILAPCARSATPAQTLLILFNRAGAAREFHLPPDAWLQVCDSASATPFAPVQSERTSLVAARSVRILTQS